MKYDIVFLHFPVYLLGFSNFQPFKNRFKFLKNFRFKKFSFSDQAAVFHVPFDPLFLADGQADLFGCSLLCFSQNHAIIINFFFIASQARINLFHAFFAPAKFLPFLCQCSDIRFVALDQFQPFQKRNVSARRRLFRIVNSTNARRAIPPTHFFDLVDRPSVILNSLITQHNLKVNVSKKVPFVVIRRFRH